MQLLPRELRGLGSVLGIADPPAEYGQHGARGPVADFADRQLKELGFAVEAYPTILIHAIALVARKALTHSQRAETCAGFQEMTDFDEFNTHTGLQEIRRIETLLYRAGEI
jgi:hypothetical protein